MPGAGESTVGALAAARLGMPFVDLDGGKFEKAAGMPIPRIFAAEGEARVSRRRVDGGALRRVALVGGQATAAGGGIVAARARKTASFCA